MKVDGCSKYLNVMPVSTKSAPLSATPIGTVAGVPTTAAGQMTTSSSTDVGAVTGEPASPPQRQRSERSSSGVVPFSKLRNPEPRSHTSVSSPVGPPARVP